MRQVGTDCEYTTDKFATGSPLWHTGLPPNNALRSDATAFRRRFLVASLTRAPVRASVSPRIWLMFFAPCQAPAL
jgi:hypothetical protein